MGKRVNKILWHGNDVNADGTPKPPSPATAADGLDGLNAGEVYIHEEDKAPAIYILTDAGRVVAIGGSDIETLAKTFLRKDQPDSTAYLLKLLSGAEFGEYLQGVSGGKIDANGSAELLSLVIRGLLTVDELRSKVFTSGALGSGFTLKIDENGDSYLEIDRMLVRKVATFVELLIQELKHVGGQIILSPASMKCARVEDMGDYYRCYFENTDGDRTISQQFVTGDQARCQTFNIKEGVNENVSNTYYWRLVVGTGDDYIDLSKADCDAGSTVPQAGDEIVQLGNRTDATRQGAIVLAAYGDDSPSIKLYKGINSYSLAGKEQISLSPQAVNIIADSLKFSTGENVKDELDTAKEDAAQAATDAAGAKQDAQDAKDRLDDWADDGVISPTEKQGLKDEIARIKGDYDEINAGYSKYGLGTPSTYNSAYNSYLSVLTTLSASSPEVITIPSYFASRQSTYYTQRTNALNAIAQAAKDYVDGLGDTVTETVMEAVDGKITLAVKTETSGIKDEILQETESKIQVLREEVSLYSGRITTVEKDLDTAEGKISSLETRVNSAELKITPDAIVSTVSSNLIIGGRNLLIGSSSGKGWRYGSYEDGVFIQTATTSERYISSQMNIHFEPLTEYVISFDYKSDRMKYGEVYFLDFNSSTVFGYTMFSNSSDWVHFEATITTKDAETDVGYIRIDNNGATSGTSTLWVRNVKLEEGNIPTAWTPAPEDNPTATEIASQMVQTANGFTFYGKEVNIKASIMTAENIAALNITTGKLTVTTGAKIGGWTVNGNALTCSQQAGATIKVEPSGTRFLRINATSTLMEMRADGVVGLSIYTQDTTGKCVNLMAQTGGIAMESHGNMELDARQGESIKLNGDVRVQGMALGTSIVGSNYTVPYNVSFISIQYGCTITLPANPPTGRFVICAARTNDTITFNGNGKQIYRDGTLTTSVSDSIDRCWNIFIYDSQRWVSIRWQHA